VKRNYSDIKMSAFQEFHII